MALAVVVVVTVRVALVQCKTGSVWDTGTDEADAAFCAGCGLSACVSGRLLMAEAAAMALAVVVATLPARGGGVSPAATSFALDAGLGTVMPA